MRRKFMLLVMFFLMIFLVPGNVEACDLNLTPGTFSVKAGETVTFTLQRYRDHRNCVLPLEDTNIKVTGGVVVDPGTWKKGNPDILVFKVKFSEPGQAVVRIERRCPKSGTIAAETKGMVLAAQENPPVKGNTAGSPPSAKAPTTPGTEGNSLPENTPVLPAPQEDFQIISGDSRLWYFFLFGGLVLYLFKATKLRKPWIFLSIVFLGFYLGACTCPIGGIFKLIMGNLEWVVIIPLLISLIWGRVFCGWACPMGGVQEGIFTGKGRIKVPYLLDKWLKSLKYVVLLLFAYLTFTTASYVWGDYEPFKVLFNFGGSLTATAVLIVILFISLFIERPFCRYICPLGAVFTLTARWAPVKVKINGDTCVACKSCADVCPMNAINCMSRDKNSPVIDNSECIRCLRCKETCRKKAI